MIKKDIYTIFFPGLLMAILTSLAASLIEINFLSSLAFKGFGFFTLYLICPLTFIIQGILCAKYDADKKCSICITTLFCLGLMIMNFEVSALGLILLYLLLWFAGYDITSKIEKVKSKLQC